MPDEEYKSNSNESSGNISPNNFSFSTPIQQFKIQSLSSHNKSTGENEEETDLASP